ncbi:MAG: ankyrin repeat domain-containing protein [Phycisphaerae bacterium]
MSETKWMIAAIVGGLLLVGWSVWDRHQKSVSEQRQAELVRAVAGGDANEVRRLVEQGADLNGADPNGITPLQVATSCGNVEMVNLLLQMGTNPETASGAPRRTRVRSYG